VYLYSCQGNKRDFCSVAIGHIYRIPSISSDQSLYAKQEVISNISHLYSGLV